MSMGPRAYAPFLLVLAAIAAVAFVKLSAGDRHAPANALTDQPAATVDAPPRAEIVRQPTILRADMAASPKTDPAPIRLPIRLTVEPSRRNSETHRIPTPADFAPAEFLTIPSFEPSQLR